MINRLFEDKVGLAADKAILAAGAYAKIIDALAEAREASHHASGSANLTANQVENGSTDNCEIDTITLSNYNIVCADTGVNTITVTVTDASGNAATQSTQITVMDTNSPIVMTQNVTIFLDVNGEATLTPSQVDSSSTDNCAIASMILSDSIFDCSDTVSANSVTLSITDISGNIVYQTTSLGGQAIWDGKDFNKRKVSTGIYLAICVNDDGTQSTITKIMVIN